MWGGRKGILSSRAYWVCGYGPWGEEGGGGEYYCQVEHTLQLSSRVQNTCMAVTGKRPYLPEKIIERNFK